MQGYVRFPTTSALSWVKLYLRLPEGMKVKSVSERSRAELLPDEGALYFRSPQGDHTIEVAVEPASGR